MCPYCSFYKEASDRNRTRAFLDAVLLEAERYADRLRPRTIFFGGGTPSALSTSQLEFLLGGLRDRLDLSAVSEWTLEMNPATVSLEKARVLRDLGVNRVSMGVQSWDNDLLKTLGRVHDAAQARRSYEILRAAGIPNVNLDLIFGVPGQSTAQWHDSLDQTTALAPDHISAYCLTYEEDTEFFLRLQRGDFQPDEHLDAALFESTMERLDRAGYPQYEISNYSRPGRECRHNLAYWTAADYVGLGPSAFSTCGAERWKNVSSTEIYVAKTLANLDPADFRESVSAETRTAEFIAFALRTADGVPSDLLTGFPAETSRLLAAGYLEATATHHRLTRPARLLADEIATLFIPEPATEAHPRAPLPPIPTSR